MSCKNATCVVCVLETAGMRFSSRRSDSGYKANSWSPATMLQQRTDAVEQVDFFQVLELVRQNEKARRLVSSTPQED